MSSTCHVSSLAAPDTDHKHKVSFTYLSEHTRSLVHDPYSPCEVPRQSGGSTQVPSLTGYEPKAVGFKHIDTDAIEPEDLEPSRIELGRNLGKDPYQIQDRFLRKSLIDDMDEFGKVGADTSYLQPQMHSCCDSAESNADSDLEDGGLRQMLASPLYLQSRSDHESSRMPVALGKPAALLQERGASAKRTRADLRTGLMSSSSQEPSAPGKPAALFSFGSEEQGHQFKSSVFKYADPSNLGTSLLEGNTDHLLSQAKSDVTRRELQQRSQDAQHGYIESRRQQVRRQEELSLKEKVLRNTQIRNMHEMVEIKRELKSAAHFTIAENAITDEFF